MSNAKNLKKPPSSEKPVLQLTRYQVLLTVCALLVTMCIAFLTGQFLNAYQARTQTAQSEAENARQSAVERSGGGEGTQISPRPVVLPPAPNKQSPETVSPANADRPSGPAIVPAPAPRREEAGRSETPTISTASESTSTNPTARSGPAMDANAPAPPSTSMAAESPQPIPVATVPVSAPSVASPPTGEIPPTPASEPARSGAASADSTGLSASEIPVGPYTIQVAAFDAKTPARAQEYKRRVAGRSDYAVFLLLSNDRQLIRACIGSYPDRESAEAARAELQKIKEFEKCFVRTVQE